MDDASRFAGSTAVSPKANGVSTARDWEIVEIDSFAALPTDPADAVITYAGYDLKFVLIDRDAFVEIIKNQSVEGQRCAKKRMTGYNWQGQMIFSIWRGVNSYAMVARAAGQVTFASGNFTVKNGTTSVTTGDSIAPGTVLTIAATTGYDLSTVTVNGTSLTIADDKATFAMPQGDAAIVVTTASE